jgi:uncharacterized membrane protein YkvA (DUF1232 family)
MQIDPERYTSKYSDQGFWKKLGRFAVKAGREVVEQALVLYYLIQDDDVPARPKAIAIGALGYFILPFDVIPDILPGVGFTDDLAVIGTAMWQLASHITDEHRARARAKLVEWFGPAGASG